MDLSFLQDYIVLVVLGICVCVGLVIKNLIPAQKVNKFIPLIMAVLGTVLNVWFNNWQFTPEILLGGLASGLASTGAYEAVKNILKLVKNNDEEEIYEEEEDE